MPKSALPFKAFDGEGWTVNEQHRLTLLGSAKSHIYDPNGLKLDQILDYLWDESERSIPVWYSAGYDWIQIIRLLSRKQQMKLYTTNSCAHTARHVQWGIRVYWGKMLELWRISNGKKRRRLMFDVYGFFQTSFLRAAHSMQALDSDEYDFIQKYKDLRDNFKTIDLNEIIRYNALECVVLERIMLRLRELLRSENMMPRHWYGPGAIANKLLREHEIKSFARPKLSDAVEDAVNRAFFGGRIQLLRPGLHSQVYAYDIRSAYPYAMTRLRVPASWTPIHSSRYTNHSMAVWRIRWSVKCSIGPFPWRERDGRIVYPASGEGWYWSPEISAALAIFGDSIEIIEGYIWRPTRSCPFDWVEPLYRRRMLLKQQGKVEQLAAKLALNSLYGKLAQQTGSAPYQNMIWAGLITSHTRAQIMHAIMQMPDSIVAIATDGILSTEALDLPLSSALGDWDYDVYNDMFILQAGLWRAFKHDSPVIRSRGWRPDELDWDGLADIWRQARTLPVIQGKTRVLVGLASGLLTKQPMGEFINEDKSLNVFNPRYIWDGERFLPPQRDSLSHKRKVKS